MKKIIENVRFMQDGTLVFGDLHIEDGFVERVEYKTPRGPSHLVIPGFVDLHTHGFRGYHCEETAVDKLHRLAEEYAKRGVTTFCPTLAARPLSEYIPYLEAYHEAFSGEYRGARYGGVHLEGPYLALDRCPTMKQEHLQRIHLDALDDFLGKYHEDIRIMTIAPELENAMEAIHLLHLYGVEVSLGHTNATYEQTMQAFDEGATQITHLCNAMPCIDHHKANMMDAILLSDCSCELIMDHAHIQPQMMKWLLKLLGSKRVIAVSDGTAMAGLAYPEGHLLTDGSNIQDEAVYLDGNRMGGCADLLSIFQKLYPIYGLQDSIAMTSRNASMILKSYTGEIALGRKVDLVILDQELQLQDVWIDGRSVL